MREYLLLELLLCRGITFQQIKVENAIVRSGFRFFLSLLFKVNSRVKNVILNSHLPSFLLMSFAL